MLIQGHVRVAGYKNLKNRIRLYARHALIRNSTQEEGMKLKNKKLKTSVLLTATFVATLAILGIWANVGPKSTGLADDNQGFSLVRPAFAQSMARATSFLDQEAGMAIWLNATAYAPLNLNTAKNQMVNIENVTSDYVLGSLSDNGGISSSDDYPHCVVFASGWIVVYYLKVNTQNPITTGWIGKIIDWSHLSQISLPITSNLLYDGLYYIATQTLGIPITNAKYYHFQHPVATKLLFAIKRGVPGQNVTFNIEIPGALTIYEYSWSTYRVGSGSYVFWIDRYQVLGVNNLGRHYGGPEIDETILTPNVPHTITLWTSTWTSDPAYVCLILLYS
jgi:hypothetical protein